MAAPVQDAEATTLEFQEFQTVPIAGSTDSSASRVDVKTENPFEDEPDTGHGGSDDAEQLLSDTEPAPPTYTSAFWTLDYYRQFFDVDTEQVLSRLKNSCYPYKNNFLRKIKTRGDLYGPFWTSTTLVFVMAMASNMANYFATQGAERLLWHYDFRKVTAAATTVYTYTTLIPFIVWIILRWHVKNPPSLLDIFCIYGYSLFIFIPASILCVMPFIGNSLRWTFVTLALVLSGGVLLQNFSVALRGARPQVISGSLGLIAACHIALALGFKLYFFYR